VTRKYVSRWNGGGVTLGGYLETVASNLRQLAGFRGRSGSGSFWTYTLTILAVSFLAGLVVMIPMMVDLFQRMMTFAAEHPEQAIVTRTPTSFSVRIKGFHPELMPDFSAAVFVLALAFMGMVVLLAGAVTRRLHDTGRSGLWGLMPLPFIAFSLALFSVLTKGFADGGGIDMGRFTGLFASNLLYLVTLGRLVFMLCDRSQPGDNRFGPPPDRAR
jgi:uncharacterized membrane protein YhaH (DUF805 family)